MANSNMWFLCKRLFVIFFVICISFSAPARDTGELNLSEEDVESPDADFLKRVKTLKAKKLSDLVYLSPFSDVAVIQRRFMPKTGRVSLSALSAFVLSSEYFLHPGVEGHLTYYFLEKHGVELSGYYVLTIDRGVTSDLEDIDIFVKELKDVVVSYVGLNYKWIPVYGKIAFYNSRILAFDTFFNFGGGLSAIASTKVKQVDWEPAVAAGIGQVFAITRDLGLRWNLRVHTTFRTSGASRKPIVDVLFSIGLNYYYPSAGLR